MKRLLVISILWTFAMINASANKVAKSFCGVATQGCASFTETHEESNDMYGKIIKAEDSSKERMCLPVDVMTLLAYQVKGNEGVERYLTKHGFKYEGRFVPEDLNPDFYFQKKYCKGCTVNKKGEVVIKKREVVIKKEKEVNKKGKAKNIKGQTKNEDQQGCMVEIGSLGFGTCTTIAHHPHLLPCPAVNNGRSRKAFLGMLQQSLSHAQRLIHFIAYIMHDALAEIIRQGIRFQFLYDIFRDEHHGITSNPSSQASCTSCQ